MEDLLKRTLTGLVYISLLLFSIFWSAYSYDILILLFGISCLYELKKILNLESYWVFLFYLGLGWLFIHKDPSVELIFVLACLTLTVDFVLVLNLVLKQPLHFNELQKTVLSLLYVGGGIIFLILVPHRENGFEPWLITGVLVLIWANDSFAYLVGRFFGKRRWLPDISPMKTVEGYIGGLLFSVLAAILISRYISILSLGQWMIMSLTIVVFGNIGDLVESKLKRSAGVKDSGDILPGHGGLLDRLDSLLFAAPFAFLVLHLFEYVS